MRVNCREQIANPAEPVNGQDERRKCAYDLRVDVLQCGRVIGNGGKTDVFGLMRDPLELPSILRDEAEAQCVCLTFNG